jgi:hypothetical protein
VSICPQNGREKIPSSAALGNIASLRYRKGEVDLMLVKGKWYLAVG